MQKVKIPHSIDPIKAAQKRLDYVGMVARSDLKRLQEFVVAVKDDAQVCLSFDLDEQKLIVISGKANIEVDLECQRCNESFAYQCETQFVYTPYLGAKTDEEAPEEYDLVDLNEFGEINLVQLLEDEFIVHLPQVAMHNDEDCRVDVNNMVFGELPEEALVEKPNPFDVLKSLKK